MKYILSLLYSGILIIALFSSCISSEEVNYLQAINTQNTYQTYEEYKLKVGDYISCAISSEDEEIVRAFSALLATDQRATKTYVIYEDGTVIYPIFGSVEIAGHTVQEAEDILQKMMQKTIKDVQVKLSMANNFFYILADNKQGSFYVYKDNMTIFQALAISQQTTNTMDLTKVTILRKDENGRSMKKTFDLRSQDVVQSEFYYIQPNDVIYFPTNKNSFFDISSVGAFTSAMMVPLSFLLYSVIYNF